MRGARPSWGLSSGTAGHMRSASVGAEPLRDLGTNSGAPLPHERVRLNCLCNIVQHHNAW